jgi:homoaconitate hydratase
MVIAASFSQTYLRNAFNNAFICVESPALVEAVRSAFSERATAGERTIAGDELVVDVTRSVALWRGRDFPMTPLGPAAQELILAGGLEALTRRRLGL